MSSSEDIEGKIAVLCSYVCNGKTYGYERRLYLANKQGLYDAAIIYAWNIFILFVYEKCWQLREIEREAGTPYKTDKIFLDALTSNKPDDYFDGHLCALGKIQTECKQGEDAIIGKLKDVYKNVDQQYFKKAQGVLQKRNEKAHVNSLGTEKEDLEQVSVSSEPASPSYGNEFSVARTNGVVVSELEGLMNTYLSKTPDKSLNLSLDMTSEMRKGMPSGMHSMGSGGMAMSDMDMGMGDDGDALEWEDTMAGMNTQSNSNMMKWKLVDKTSGKVNMDITDWNFQTGDKVKIRIFNDPQSMHPMQHPVHFHGQRLMVLSTNGVRNSNPVWADTVLVAKGDTVDILLDASNPGTWVAHCHILEHAESGMMLSYTVGKNN